MSKGKKSKPKVIKRIPKNVKQHVVRVSDEKELLFIAEQYKNAKNYVYSRYSGVNSLPMLKDYKKRIRDIWVKDEFAKQWKLPARYWKLALDEAISNIKSKWSNIKNDIRKAIRENSNVTEDERSFIYYILKADDLLYAILTYEKYITPKKLVSLEIRQHYVHQLIRRYVRKYKKGIPFSKKATTFMVDQPMYKYDVIESKPYIEVTSSVPRKRIFFELKEKNQYKGNIRIVIRDDGVELHHLVEVKVKSLSSETNEVGVDKGHRTLLATSSGHLYGENLNELLNKETERLNKVNAKRNPYYALVRKYEAEGNLVKANTIRTNNLGKKKYNKQKKKHDATVKSYINDSLNQFIFSEKPSDMIQEDLSFVSWNDKFPKHVKRKLSRWIKGYIKDRLEYKAELYKIKIHKVNAAYTSQVCYKCGCFGHRNVDVFTCTKCGEIHADINASHNIKERKNDKEITLYTNYKTVKQILENRITAKVS
ncbi:zinc ribbon domain-containing protein [Microbacteriaceae bacterium 4G12]